MPRGERVLAASIAVLDTRRPSAPKVEQTKQRGASFADEDLYDKTCLPDKVRRSLGCHVESVDRSSHRPRCRRRPAWRCWAWRQ